MTKICVSLSQAILFLAKLQVIKHRRHWIDPLDVLNIKVFYKRMPTKYLLQESLSESLSRHIPRPIYILLSSCLHNYNILFNQSKVKAKIISQLLLTPKTLSMEEEIIIEDPIEYLVSVTTSCLLNEARYYESSEERREILLNALTLVEAKDPEFILQLAVYIRRELGLRTTTNFILAYCASSPAVSPFLKKYFSTATVLPGDLIECVQFTQFIANLRKGNNIQEIKLNAAGETFDIRKKITIPNQLKKVLIPKILAFSEYQLGKHSSEGNRKSMLDSYYSLRQGLAVRRRTVRRRIKLGKPAAAAAEPQVDLEKIKSKRLRAKIMKKAHQPKLPDPSALRVKAVTKTFLSLKDLIGLLHMKPTLLTSKVLGSKYPSTKEQFEKKFGEGGFDEQLAGKRMKLQVPVTWETELSGKGNSKEVWTQLITNNKVPYLALLRNLRNLIKADLDPEIYEKIAKYLSNPEVVEKVRATPLQYYSALEEVRKLGLYNIKAQGGEVPKQEDSSDGEDSSEEEQQQEISQSQMQSESQSQMLVEDVSVSESAQQAVEESNQEDSAMIEQNIAEPEKPKYIPPPLHILDSTIVVLKEAINTAIHLSVKNLDPIKGVTQIFVDVSGSMQCPLSGGKKFGSVRMCSDLSILLGLLVKKICEKSEYYIFSSPSKDKCYIKLDQYLTGDLEKDMKVAHKKSGRLGGGTDFPEEVVSQALEKKEHIDNMIILSDMMISEGFTGGSYVQRISQYRNQVNPNLKVFSVDLRGYEKTQNLKKEFKEHNFIRVYGASASILKFISAKQGDQIAYIREFAKGVIE